MTLWNEIDEMFKASNKKVEICEVNDKTEKTIEYLRISTNSVIGSIIYNTHYIIVDNWVRLLGNKSEKYDGIVEFNSYFKNYVDNMFAVATDVVGGIFAINNGRYSEDIGKIWYLAPDTLEWESLSLEYSEFVAWLAKGDVDEFYQSMRWNNWIELSKNVEVNQGILIYPFLWSNEIILQSATKKIVPFYELININMDYIKKLGIDN